MSLLDIPVLKSADERPEDTSNATRAAQDRAFDAVEALQSRTGVARQMRKQPVGANADGQFTVSSFVTHRFRYKMGKPFSLNARPWQRAIYDSEYTRRVGPKGGELPLTRRTILLTARQCEKCVPASARILLENGRYVAAKDIRVGDHVIAYSDSDGRVRGRMVTAAKNVGMKPSLRITTASGHTTVVADTHPLRTWEGYVEASQLREGQALMTALQRGVFRHGSYVGTDADIELATYLLLRGIKEEEGVRIRTSSVELTSRVISALSTLRMSYVMESMSIFCPYEEVPGLASIRHFITRHLGGAFEIPPEWIYDLDARQSSVFLQAALACGSRGERKPDGKFFASVSSSTERTPVLQTVQDILSKFRVLSTIQRTGYRASLSFRDQQGLAKIASIVPSKPYEEEFDAPAYRETPIPIPRRVLRPALKDLGFNQIPRDVYRSWLLDQLRGRPLSPAQKRTVAQMVTREVQWDTIARIEPVPATDCYDFEVDVDGTFVCDDFITHNSTGLGNKILAFASLIPNFTGLYVSTADKNLEVFGKDRLEDVLEFSPYLQSFLNIQKNGSKWIGYQSSRYLKYVRSLNSKILLRSVNLSPDRVRGIAADGAFFDEGQDLSLKNIQISIATTNNSALEHGPLIGLAGTPKTLDNSMSLVWRNESTQGYWMIRCQGCRHWQYASLEQVGPMGLICEKCGKALNPIDDAEWVLKGSPDATYRGYHLSRPLMAYSRARSYEQFSTFWKTMLTDLESPNMTEAVARNEIIGEPWDSGTKPITQDELRRCCTLPFPPTRSIPKQVISNPGHPAFMGIDWGEGQSGKSYTVVSIGYYNGTDSTYHIPCLYRYMGTETGKEYIIQDIINLVFANQVKWVFADAGHGWGMIQDLWKLLPNGRRRVIPVQYQKPTSQPIVMDKRDRKLLVNRTRIMNRFLNLMKRKRIRLPEWEPFYNGGLSESSRGFGQDVLTLREEHDYSNNTVKFVHSDPDDGFHAMLYGEMAATIHYGRVNELRFM